MSVRGPQNQRRSTNLGCVARTVTQWSQRMGAPRARYGWQTPRTNSGFRTALHLWCQRMTGAAFVAFVVAVFA